MGIPSHPRLPAHEGHQPGHNVVWLEEPWDGLLSRRLRRPFIKTLRTAIDTGLTRLMAEVERQAA